MEFAVYMFGFALMVWVLCVGTILAEIYRVYTTYRPNHVVM